MKTGVRYATTAIADNSVRPFIIRLYHPRSSTLAERILSRHADWGGVIVIAQPYNHSAGLLPAER